MGVTMNEIINIKHEIHELAMKIKEELIKRGEMMATADPARAGLSHRALSTKRALLRF